MSAHEIDAAEKIATAWARTLSGIRDPQLQVGWLREQLAGRDAAQVANVLTIVLARAEQREERHAVLLLRVSLALADAAGQGLKRALACFAEAHGQLALVRFLGGTDTPPEPASHDALTLLETPDSPPGASGNAVLRRALAAENGRPLSLGERKSLARTRDRPLLARVLRDPHPDVVRILLDNPALTEIDIVRLCARRPIRAAVLTQVFRHSRWVLRYRVRLALVLNPHTPDELALQLLPHLTEADLRSVARAGDLSERVRAACSTSRDSPLH